MSKIRKVCASGDPRCGRPAAVEYRFAGDPKVYGACTPHFEVLRKAFNIVVERANP